VKFQSRFSWIWVSVFLLAWSEAFCTIEKGTSKAKSQSGLSFIYYIDQLLAAGKISQSRFNLLVGELERGRWLHPILVPSINGRPFFHQLDDQIHYEALQRHASSEVWKSPQVLRWLQDRRKSLQQELRATQKLQRKHQNPHLKLAFSSIFFGGVEWSQTPVTQYHWFRLMGAQPSYFTFGSESQVFEDPLTGKEIRFQPDHPVEQVSYYQVQEFVQRLNQRSQAGDLEFEEWMEDYREGDLFTLPSPEQWQWVSNQVGLLSESDIEEVVWMSDNSSMETHRVASKFPLRFLAQTQGFYDLYGNVWEWISDGSLKGGRWASSRSSLVGRVPQMRAQPSFRSSGVGFRLARHRNPSGL
jgi:hypothetical protein